MKAEPEVSVVIPTYQRRRSVAATLAAVLDQDAGRPFEVIAVDNGSTDGTADDLARLEKEHDHLRVLRLDPNRGPGPARNAGWREAAGRTVVFTDDDCIPSATWLRSLTDAIDDGADVVMGRTVPDADDLAEAGPFSHWVKVDEPMPWFPTCNIAYRRELIGDLGGFDESFTAQFGSSFGDDTDLGWRALEAGAETRFCPEALVVHEVTRSDWRAWMRARRRRGGVPEVVARHPGLRAQLPRRWLYERSHLPAVLAGGGILLLAARPRSALAWFGAGLLARPYIAFRVSGEGRRPVPGGRTPRAVAGLLAGDLLETAIVAWNARRARIFLV